LWELGDYNSAFLATSFVRARGHAANIPAPNSTADAGLIKMRPLSIADWIGTVHATNCFLIRDGYLQPTA
jgi:hypothetical protein